MIYAILLAAGRGTRFGADKTTAHLGGKPLWQWSYETLSSHQSVSGVVCVHGEENFADMPNAVPGGSSRQQSVASGIAALPAGAEWALIHDSARPLLPSEVIDRLLAASDGLDGVAPVVPVVDTIRDVAASDAPIVDRSKLRSMQTPQLVRVSAYRQALASTDAEFTDDLAVLQGAGLKVGFVEGDALNFKITSASDLVRARQTVGAGCTRTGLGYDIHSFSEDRSRVLWLGGVSFPGEPALDGHSDADVVLHAVVDAMLGAVAAGDIGQHFPNSDPRWKGEPSSTFVTHAAAVVARAGYRIENLDIAVIAELPKVMPRADEIRSKIAELAGIGRDAVGFKATTNERLGSIGRGEGIAAFAIATVSPI